MQNPHKKEKKKKTHWKAVTITENYFEISSKKGPKNDK